MKLAGQLLAMDYCTTNLPLPLVLSDSSCTSSSSDAIDLNIFQMPDSSDCIYQGIIYTNQLNNSNSFDTYNNSFHGRLGEEVTDIRHHDKSDGLQARSLCPKSVNKKLPRNTRIMRNVAEKQRRDKLNNCISKLASLVPLVSLSNKRINKSGILRLAASYLRLHSGAINRFMKENSFSFLPFLDRELSQFLLDMTEGFAVITDESLKVLFTSDLIESFLRHSVVDVLGQPFSNLIHPDDCVRLEEILKANEDKEKEIFSLYCSMIEGNNDGRTKSNYKLMRIVGYQKSFSVNRDSRGENTGKLYIFIVKLCLVQPRNTITWTTNPNEITFRSAFTGRCLFVDHKLSILLGIMPLEIEGSSGYDYIYKEDHPIAAVAHTQMLTDGCFRGIPLRLLTKNKQTVFFMTAGKLVSSYEGGPVDLMYMVCTMISSEEGERIQALVRHRLANQIGLCAPHDFDANLTSEDMIEKNELKESITQPVKRPRGRPRKYPINSTSALKSQRQSGANRVTDIK